MDAAQVIDRLHQEGVLSEDERGRLIAEVGDGPVALAEFWHALDGDARPEAGPAVAEALGLPWIAEIDPGEVDTGFFEYVSFDAARREAVVGLRAPNEMLQVAAALPLRLEFLDELGLVTDRPVRVAVAPREAVLSRIDAAAQSRPDELAEAVDELDSHDLESAVAEVERLTDFANIAEKAPVVRLVQLLIARAAEGRASDIHFQPVGDRLTVRFRIDGVLHDVMTVPRLAQEAMLARIKVIARMDVSQRRRPQDGRASFRCGDREIDVRVSVIPTAHGERAVLRLLNRAQQRLELEELGLAESNLETVARLVRSDHGMFFATGPTGSGKTTTLYAALRRVISPEMNVITIEDPIEYRLTGASQMQVSDKPRVTFADALRSVLRQDPDVLMVGEVRDRETAEIAVQAALTGHLIFSTLHTNDAPAAVARLLDLGVEPHLVSTTLLCVLAQRLVRRVCPHCGRPAEISSEDVRDLGLSSEAVAEGRFRVGDGCAQCLDTGYLGRIGLYELLSTSEELREQVHGRESTAGIRQAAIRRGMRTLLQDGARKVLDGVTTPSEVLRVTRYEAE